MTRSSHKPDTGGASAPSSQPHVSRRLFLKTSGAAAAVAGIPAAAVAQEQPATPVATPEETGAGPSEPVIKFFNNVEADVVERLTAAILPGDENDPGAREAGVVNYIDNALHGTTGGYTFKTYTQGPYLIVSQQQPQVEVTSRPTLFEVQAVNTETLASRYGYQTMMPPQEIYKRGIESVMAHAQAKFQSDFADLSDDQVEQILEDMESDDATEFDMPSGPGFFSILRNDTIEGMFSDPMYGGNRDLAGWKLIGYPGPRGFYTADEMHNPDFHVQPISLADMVASNQHQEG